MAYVDGFVLPVPTRNLAAKVWREHGALEYREAAGDEMATPFGVPFGKLAKAKRGETVVFAWIVYKSKAHRNAVNKRVMADERLKAMCGAKMPFDVKRMSYGGFRVIVAA